MPREFKSFRIDKIDIGGRDGEDYRIRFCDVFGDKIAGLLLDV